MLQFQYLELFSQTLLYDVLSVDRMVYNAALLIPLLMFQFCFFFFTGT